MSASTLETTACPIPAEASTTTDRVAAARMAQRGLRRGTGAYGTRAGLAGPPGPTGCRGARCGRGRGRYCVLDMGDTSAEGVGGHRVHRRGIRSADRRSGPRGAHRCPPFAVT
ncbi:hypothetical protein GCM10009564_26830 [Streptomyces thermogriseus]|uniref:Uncharacterized protein n=1 Tax=Streptomyces thermogriseus TaxID=75292 RepID=A0ABN1SZZ2_9ACTN